MLLTLRTRLCAPTDGAQPRRPPALRRQPGSEAGRGPRPRAGSRPAPPRLGLSAVVRADPGQLRGVTAPSLAPALLPCALPRHLLLWKARPCTRATASGGDGPAFLSAPTAPHALRAAAQLWTLQPGPGRRSPSPPGSSCSGLGHRLSVPQSAGQREGRKTPGTAHVSLLALRLLPQLVVCHMRVARALPTSPGSSGPEARLQSQALLWGHAGHSFNKSFCVSTMRDALRSRDACSKDLALLGPTFWRGREAVNPEFNQMFSISR